jgi:UDP-N-acetyl-D-glucosamine dehydrogenase
MQGTHRLESVAFDASLASSFDCAVICTDHTSFDYKKIAASLALVVDTRNALKGLDSASIFRV